MVPFCKLKVFLGKCKVRASEISKLVSEIFVPQEVLETTRGTNFCS